MHKEKEGKIDMHIGLNSLIPFKGNFDYDYKNKNSLEKNKKQDSFEIQIKKQLHSGKTN